MVTHKLHLHDNKMDGSCITTPSEAVNIALLPIPPPCKLPHCEGKVRQNILLDFEWRRHYCYCLWGDIEAESKRSCYQLYPPNPVTVSV